MTDTRRDPHPIDLVHELDEALHGYTTAQPRSPAEVWADLLAEVRLVASGRCHACLHGGWHDTPDAGRENNQ